MERIFAIGDIHGCFEKLVILMDKIDIDLEKDTLIFMGDYIDRGPASFEVVAYLNDLRKRCPKALFLKGNHEDMLGKYLSGPDKDTYIINGGKNTLDSYISRSQPGDSIIPREHLDFFGSLLPYYETKDYIFIHAGLRENMPPSQQEEDDLLWIRHEFIQSDYDFGKRVIFGHTPFLEPFVRANKIGIDTGAVYGNKLTCVRLPDVEFISDV